MNELDQILVPFVTKKFQQLEELEKTLFLELLEFEDVDLTDLILYKKVKPSEKFKKIISKIIEFSNEI